MNTFQCPLCGDRLEVRNSKTRKPYLVCEDCGYQWFIRSKNGIRRLEEISNRRISFLDKYILCRKCRVAVERCAEKVRKFIIGQDGIYCPECESLLLKARDLKGAGDESD